ncbi:YicC family protein [Kaistia algarum]|uniref:YicC/YloC family endoribonuclease n=1 Tax=Kaistia algarum TaxID=2083279 RepID=UPI000CE89206|nr:YicC/YloC family endoribonuclease [Kaistia algarum]MCX5511976.1 YicC family protein [Kaistia algarum]PPE80106.1 YicC family protein [Kaistia algarum]
MTLMSMTGFARAAGAGFGYRWTWELRSVNGKGLDVRLRLPPGHDHLDQPARERIASRLHRGSLQAGLSLQREASATTLKVNEELLASLLDLMRRVGSEIAAAPPTLDGILSIRGVIETVEAEDDPATASALATRILDDLDTALAELAVARAREGAALGAILTARMDEIERLRLAAETAPARTPEAIRARLTEQVAALLGASPALDPGRLHQEAVLLATRADIREELDRLEAHVAAARDILAEGGAVGRKLDFLAQEFNRETNTLCSKANDRSLTSIGLELKAAVDQLREQVQNLE